MYLSNDFSYQSYSFRLSCMDRSVGRKVVNKNYDKTIIDE
jgi:hypothetical protein